LEFECYYLPTGDNVDVDEVIDFNLTLSTEQSDYVKTELGVQVSHVKTMW